MSTQLHLTDGRTIAINIDFAHALDLVKNAKDDDLLLLDQGNGEQKRYIFKRHIVEVSPGHAKIVERKR